ncbi:hypothetical protein E2C01_022601 [Portunus trituberculatus]|uniref:Uncharacterized protein n=1 Tax=Portunus trituberculatus TaxID=210409 RepID=A0A5B7E5U0_PORTR|nr:hypothetical protein [Portunus trituberculatus]
MVLKNTEATGVVGSVRVLLQWTVEAGVHSQQGGVTWNTRDITSLYDYGGGSLSAFSHTLLTSEARMLAGTGTISHLARRVSDPSLSQPGGHIIIYKTSGVQGNQGYGKRKYLTLN